MSGTVCPTLVSNYMYRGFVFAQDAIADFVRSLERADKVAFYSYSRDLYRAAALTSDRSEVVRGVRTSVAGDDAALYNSLLLTVQDAGQDRKSTRLNSSHQIISYAVFCL